MKLLCLVLLSALLIAEVQPCPKEEDDFKKVDVKVAARTITIILELEITYLENGKDVDEHYNDVCRRACDDLGKLRCPISALIEVLKKVLRLAIQKGEQAKKLFLDALRKMLTEAVDIHNDFKRFYFAILRELEKIIAKILHPCCE